MSGDVVVVGQRIPKPGGSYNIEVYKGTGKGGYYIEAPIGDDSSPGSDEPVMTIRIGIDCSSPPECEKVEAAAAHLVRAIIAVLTACEARSLSGSVTVLGTTISIFALYSTIRDAAFVVTDKSEFGNRGQGAADHINRRDTIYYGTIGTPAVSGPNGSPATGYHQYTNGIIALVIHEGVHLTAQGYAFYQRSLEMHRNDATVQSGFYDKNDPGSKRYADNLEAFTNEMARRIGPEFGYDLPGFYPGTSAQPVDPADIYREHTGSEP